MQHAMIQPVSLPRILWSVFAALMELNGNADRTHCNVFSVWVCIICIDLQFV